MNKQEFLLKIQKEPIINSHSHHLEDREHHTMNLRNVLKNSYVSWCSVEIPETNSKEEKEAFFDAIRTRSYFVWMEKALMDLYDMKEPLNADSWDKYDHAIQRMHQDKQWHLKILQEKCKYKTVCLDAFWNPGDDNRHPELFRPAYRINSMFYGYNQMVRDHNGNNFQIIQNSAITDIDNYIKLIEYVILKKKEEGCITLKCALAYDRSLNFGVASKEMAQKAMTENPEDKDVKAFQDYIFDRICKIAAKVKMPVQIHTGLGRMEESNAMQLQSLISRNPDTTFLLMHGSYPWISDIAGLTHTYSNVWADLCWIPLISPTAARNLLHELIDVCNMDRVVWGCDTWTSEESYGARKAFLEVLSKVLCERVESGMMREVDAYRYAKAIMYSNADKLF